MYGSVAELLADYAEESTSTLRVIGAFDSELLATSIPPDGRTIGALVSHLATSARQIIGFTGVTVAMESPVDGNDDVSRQVEFYRHVSETIAHAIRSSWDEQFLLREVSVYGMTWTVAKTFQVLIRHEIHHRGQLVLLLRLNGRKVPGVYGPSADKF